MNEGVLQLQQWATDESKRWSEGKVSGAVYHGGTEHALVVNTALSLFGLTNPLHPDLFPSLMKMEVRIS
jgi:sphinganine-1-phosphate aldolase